MGFWDFLSLQNPLHRTALFGACLLAINCALLGSFLVVRRMAMTSDTLSHAVLPGVMGGYLWNLTKDPSALLLGAVISGLLGTWLLGAITSTTKLRSDAAQGIVLSLFLGVGVGISELLKNLPAERATNRGGLSEFLFGQLMSIQEKDVLVLAVALVLTVATIVLCFRPLLTLSFDRAYGAARGIPVRLAHVWFMFLTTLAIVVSMETVGVVLISALMVIPVSAAALLTQRLPKILLLASLVGVISAVMGTAASATLLGVAAGPVIVLACSVCFVLAFLMSPQHGFLARWWRHLRWKRLVNVENVLKDIFRWLEDQNLPETAAFSPSQFSEDRKLLPADCQRLLTLLQRQDFLETAPPEAGPPPALPALPAVRQQLTAKGRHRARELVRAHRLWELYLTQRVAYASDHVHEDAEVIEHMLTPENLERIAQVLGNPTHDPHGRLIPASAVE